ncbi:hypothetical protein ASPSYDRAFT_438166 [Aspergillus sydowii CBS 593.65]|uniref:Uncharacterized protein n=1 Tax=Aspergillus sydowii CBS 593.65 TaxID=1036612 RepID=A0A1L9T6U0_9EURO|nr:uncharacterized protein ASPSYDRAFT_438166 [Aspergillus sydowii CBS 593.65]OJJ55003.1 hypothetical protein ASPSYDRAFT_438166 [Aspergillus sydowii CBS 593.65]
MPCSASRETVKAGDVSRTGSRDNAEECECGPPSRVVIPRARHWTKRAPSYKYRGVSHTEIERAPTAAKPRNFMRRLISLFTPRHTSNMKWRLPLGHLSALEALISHLVRVTFRVSYFFSKPVIYSTLSPPLQVGKLVGLLLRRACLCPRRLSTT